jgi:DNA-binding protein H-NS
MDSDNDSSSSSSSEEQEQEQQQEQPQANAPIQDDMEDYGDVPENALAEHDSESSASEDEDLEDRARLMREQQRALAAQSLADYDKRSWIGQGRRGKTGLFVRFGDATYF